MKKYSVAVLTPTLGERESLLEECKASVRAQTVPVQHLIAVDEDREGPSVIRNRLAEQTDAEWLLPLDDDDLLDPEAVHLLLSAAGGSDVVYPWCRVTGSSWSPNRLFTAKTLESHNYIPVTALIRRSLWEKVKWRVAPHSEDWIFWRDCVKAGAKFTCIPEVLWTYRIGESGTSRNNWVK